MTSYTLRPHGNRWQVIAHHDGGLSTPCWPSYPDREVAQQRADTLNEWQQYLGNIVLRQNGRLPRDVRQVGMGGASK